MTKPREKTCWEVTASRGIESTIRSAPLLLLLVAAAEF